MAEVLNHFCQLRKTRPRIDFCQVVAGPGSQPRWQCSVSITVGGRPLHAQHSAANKKLAQDAATKDLVSRLDEGGFLNGLPPALLLKARGQQGPAWAIQEPPLKRLKTGGGGKGKQKASAATGPLPPGLVPGTGAGPAVALTPESQAMLDRMLSLLKLGKAHEAMELARMGLRNSPGCVSVKKFVGLASSISLRTPVEAVLKFFDVFQTMGLVSFPMPTGITYFLRFSRWAVREFLAEGQQAIDRATTVPAQILERNGNCIQMLTVTNGTKGSNEFVLAADATLPAGHGFQRGDYILLTAPHTGQVRPPGSHGSCMTVEAELTGFVPGGPGPQSGVIVKVVGSSNEELNTLAGKTCRIDRAANRVTFCRQMEALRVLCGEPGGLSWLSEILMAAEQEGGEGIAVEMCVAQPPASHVIRARGVMDKANPSQVEALKAATSRRVTLIQGPPGCGKTNTSIMLMQMLVQSNRGPVLATADSNIAVDNLVLGCSRVGLQVVRLGRHEASRHDLRQYNLTEKAKAAAPGMDMRSLWTTEKRILSAADVVCCTCSGAASAVMEDMTYPCVLVDEAGQATELSALVPLLYLRADGFLVLVGDHKQLPATVACQEAAQEGLANSLFERLEAQGVPPVALDTQYRMHPAIAAYPSKQFYQGWLKSGVPGSLRPPPKGIQWPIPQAPLAFLPVHGVEAAEGNSYTNYAEVQAITELLRKVEGAGDILGPDIGIITPYAAQARFIRQQLGVPSGNARGFLDPTAAARAAQLPEVSSVDGFQGREKDLILVSPVRANVAGRVGFISDPRRLNVSLTRARRGLVVCGHYPTLAKDEQGWGPWIAWAEDRGLVAGKPARNTHAAKELADLHVLNEDQLLKYHQQLQDRTLVARLQVVEGAGAGLDLHPEPGGMRVKQVHDSPGQPDLRPGDLIRSIDGVPLGGDVMQVGAIFGQHFRDGVVLTVGRQ